MKLVELSIDNYMGFESKTTIRLCDFTMLVGRNDVGKSSILKALDLFFNEKNCSIEMKNVGNLSNEITIELAFDDIDQPIIIDESIETTFVNEDLIDADGNLRLRKTWDVSLSKPKPQLFIQRKQYENDDFVFASETQLLKLCNQHSIETHKANGIECNNVEKRGKLREAFNLKNVSSKYVWEKLPSTGSNRQKMVYDAIKTVLPRFEYFKADSSLSESDTSIQNYFRDIATEAVSEIGISQVESNIKQRLCSVLNNITAKINAAMPNEDTVRPSLEFDWTKIVKITFTTGSDLMGIPLSMRGDGFRRVTMMSYFEHLAEEKCETSKSILFAFEEPETFLHPRAQEQLFEKLHGMAENHYQVIISTHSPILVAHSKQTELIHVHRIAGKSSIDYCMTDIRSIVEDLGITVDNQFHSYFDKAKALLLVEGVDDANAYHHTSKCYKDAGRIKATFDDLGIILLPIGGCGSVKHWVNLDLMRKLTKPWFIFLDSDMVSPSCLSSNKQTLIELGLVEGENFYITKKRTLENYIPCDALNRIVNGAELSYGDWEDIKDICKYHPLSSLLGGKNVAQKYFKELTYSDLIRAFCDQDGNDEFIRLYEKMLSIV